MRNDTMSPDEAHEFSDRIREMRWERVEARAVRRQAAAARRAGIVRSLPARLARLLLRGRRGEWRAPGAAPRPGRRSRRRQHANASEHDVTP